MQILRNPTRPFSASTAVMLGNFDGFHRAHAHLAEETVRYARKNALVPAAFSFLSPPKKGRALTTEKEKEALLEKSGIEVLFSYDFPLLSGLSPEEFVRGVLLETLGAKAVFCGFNYRFGCARAGNAETLKALLKDKAEVIILPALCDSEGTPISSSVIRTLIDAGDLRRARELLGHDLSDSIQ